jgi:hypothetical protein
LNLLPEAEASITPKGIRFDGLHYTCELARTEQWFIRAGENGARKIRIAHDPRTRSRVYLRLDGGKRLETCYLLEADKTFRDRDWYEAADEFELRKQRVEASRPHRQQTRAEFHASTNQIIEEAKKRTGADRSDVSDSERIANIRENRKLEREVERGAGAWILGEDSKEATSPDDSQEKAKSDSARKSGYIPPSQPIDKLRQIRERKLQK